MGCIVSKNKASVANSKGMSLSTDPSTLTLRTSVRKLSKFKERHFSMPRIDSLLQDSATVAELWNAILIKHTKSSRDKTEIRGSLITHFLFNSLPLKSINSIISNFSLYSFEPNSVIFNQNTIGQYFYIIDSGAVEVIVNGYSKTILHKGGHFGELALLHDTLRTATVRTIEDTKVWVLSRSDFASVIQSISKSKYVENKSFLSQIPLFNILTNVQKETMLGLLVSQEFEDGDIILNEGDPGEIFYIIKKGTVSCSIKGQEIRQLGIGDFFGEQALIYSSQRTATVTAMCKVSVLSLGAEDLVTVYGNKLQEIIYKNSQRIALEKSRYLKYLTEPQIEVCIKNMIIVSYTKGQIVFKIGSPKGDRVVMVVKGRLVSEERVLNVFDSMDDFNDPSKSFQNTWIADVDTDVATITRKELEKCLGSDINLIITQNEIMHVLRKVQLLRSLPVEKLQGLISMLKIMHFPDKSIILKQGDPGDTFFIVKEGCVEIIKDQIALRTITKDDFFGERSIIFNENRTATVVAKGDCSFWVLTKADFLEIIDEGIRKQIMKRIDLQDDSITIHELVLVKKIGEGMFGNVFLVYKSSNNAAYALKVVDRWKINEYNIYDNILLERKILLQLDHPMLMKLVKTFKDPQRIYFLMELVQGVDLFDVLRAIERMDEQKSLFYICCLLLILQYLHERNIVYRDLKPENIMIDEEGYPKLIDFGTAKIVEERTYTRVGTPHYMAPEVIKGTGYGLEADYWSLGIMLYEFLFFNVPFAEDETDTYKIYKAIQENEIKIPKLASGECRNLLERLLNKTPAMRGNYESIMTHSWFEGVKWDRFLAKQNKPPYVPKIHDIRKLIPLEEASEKDFFQNKIKFLHADHNIISTKTRKIANDWDVDF